jgi:hypothetical protein
MTRKNPAAVSLGRKGGKAGTGKAKARTSEQARAAVLKRWENHRCALALAPAKNNSRHVAQCGPLRPT